MCVKRHENILTRLMLGWGRGGGTFKKKRGDGSCLYMYVGMYVGMRELSGSNESMGYITTVWHVYLEGYMLLFLYMSILLLEKEKEKRKKGGERGKWEIKMGNKK